MLEWLLKRLRWSGRASSASAEVEYDPVYGLSRRALADWLRWNPQLAADHELLELAALRRRAKAAASSGRTNGIRRSRIGHPCLKRVDATPANVAGECPNRDNFSWEPAAMDGGGSMAVANSQKEFASRSKARSESRPSGP
jgi:hypothetical protein